jgi:uncharacterized protein YkwD
VVTKRTQATKRTRRFGVAAAALAIAGVGAACVPSPAPAPPAAASYPACGPGGPPDATTSTIFNLTNSSRGASGLGGLAWSRQLYCLASEWSANMAAQGRMYHRDLNSAIRSSGYNNYRTLGENVFYGPAGTSGASMHTAWMSSAGHRANILSGAFTSFAVATYTSGGTVWATENFGG